MSPAGANDDEFEAFLEVVADELEKINRSDIEFTASLTKREAIFTVFSSATVSPSADKFMADIRTALHAANCATPGWENARLRLNAESQLEDEILLDA